MTNGGLAMIRSKVIDCTGSNQEPSVSVTPVPASVSVAKSSARREMSVPHSSRACPTWESRRGPAPVPRSRTRATGVVGTTSSMRREAAPNPMTWSSLSSRMRIEGSGSENTHRGTPPMAWGRMSQMNSPWRASVADGSSLKVTSPVSAHRSASAVPSAESRSAGRWRIAARTS